jgi:hypothetical protein
MNRYRSVLALAAAGAVAFAASAGTTAATSAAGPPGSGRAVTPTGYVSPLGSAPLGSAPLGFSVAAGGSAGADGDPMTSMTAALKTTGHNVEMLAQGSTMTGSVDPATDTTMAVAKSSGMEIDEIVSHGRIYLRADLGADLDGQVGITPNVWMQMDPAQIAADNELLIQPDGSDPVDLAGIMTGITKMQRVDAQHVAGTMDLTKVTGHTLPDPDEVAKAGAAATAVPFTARADASGRIVEFSVSANAFDPALSLDVLYTDYGAPSPITVPAASVAAPQTLYSIFNG